MLGRAKSWLLAHGDYELTPQETHTLQTSLKHLLQGVPLPHILGEWEFYGRQFHVSPEVLIPRPETELLVERALQVAESKAQPQIADVGTGSGVIAISLAVALPAADILAIDLSRAALRIARKNATRHQQQHRIQFLQADLLLPVHAHFDLICANLPYIPTTTLDTLAVSKWEPRLALDGGEGGLDLIERLLCQARMRLGSRGTVLLETEATLGPATLVAAQSAFPTAHVTLHQDLAGQDRLVEITCL